MGKPRVIAETGAGQHGVATATACARFGFECVVYMGEEDIRRQTPNVFRMKILGAEVSPSAAGSATLKDAINEAMRHWVTHVRDTHYILGSVAGPHPYPMIVRDFQSVIGRETRRQILKQEGRLPDCIIACVGGGSNAIGDLLPLPQRRKREADRRRGGGPRDWHQTALASTSAASIGVLHGSMSYVLQDDAGQIREVHSVAAGLDYPGWAPSTATGRDGTRNYTSTDDRETLEAFRTPCPTEGIIPALESAHAVANAMRWRRR